MREKKHIICAALCVLLISVICITGIWNKKNNIISWKGTSDTESGWLDMEDFSEEDFDFGLDGSWLDLNDMEYALKDRLKCYLFIGTDHSGNENAKDDSYEGTMADFLLLAVFNKTAQQYGFIQINRDTLTNVQILDKDGDVIGESEEQICTAHWYGGSRQQSCLNTVDAVSQMLGDLPIDGYYSVGMDEIAKLNHIIGGARVTIEDDFSKVDKSLVKGKTLTLTDEQAYNYLHARIDVGDGENESRMRRQRQYMESVYDKVIDRVKAEKDFLEDITDTLDKSVTTNMDGNDFGEIRNVIQKGESLGIFFPKGESMLGDTLKDGLEHTEFYVDGQSVADIMQKLCRLELMEFDDWGMPDTEAENW